MRIEEYIETYFEEAVQDIISVVNIRSVKESKEGTAPYGKGIQKALETTLSIAEKLGFKTKNLENYVGYAEYGEGEEYLAILGHLDVVPEGDMKKWKTDPYAATVVGEELVGRGVLDNKGPIISTLYSLKALVEMNPSFCKRVRIIFGTNEESGDEDIKYYLQKEKAPKYCFTPDGRFPVIYAEKGIFTFRFLDKFNSETTEILTLHAGEKSNIVPELCKLSLRKSAKKRVAEALKKRKDFSYLIQKNSIEITSYGKAAHASSPEKGENALVKMYRFLEEILPKQDSSRKFVDFVNQYIGEDLYGEKLGIGYETLDLGRLSLNLAITRIENGEIFVKSNIRYPKNEEYEDFEQKLQSLAVREKIEFRKENQNPPLYFSKNSVLVKSLQKVYREITKREEEAASIGGGTYAKLMPNTVAFGPNYKEYNGNPHGPNESIHLGMLKEGMIIYAYALKELSKHM